MPKGQKPTGFIARCPWCGVITGAMDYERTDRKEAGTMLGEWLMTGHVVEPRFNHRWSATVESCQCADDWVDPDTKEPRVTPRPAPHKLPPELPSSNVGNERTPEEGRSPAVGGPLD